MYVEMLLGYSCKQFSELDRIRNRITEIDTDWNEFTEQEYYMILEDLRNSQIDKISNGLSYNQTEIRNHLRKLK